MTTERSVPTRPTTSAPPGPLHLLRAVGNALNLSTPLGLAVAAAGKARLRRGPAATVLAEHYRLPLPKAGAFVVGGVILIPQATMETLEAKHPGTLAHEDAHVWQYFYCLGLPFLPLYALASAWSWLRRGDPSSGNWFERGADLVLGGYVERPITNEGINRLLRRSG